MIRILLIFGGAMLHTACLQTSSRSYPELGNQDSTVSADMDTATFSGGCFWCTEVQFRQLAGVDTVVSGYTGGKVANPSYKQVTTGRTGHAEAINVVYTPDEISYDELLEAFFIAHDPTQLNRQGNDIGTQYRSTIFYHDEIEKEKAEYYISRLTEEKVYEQPIVTTLERYADFYIAEDYHQNYFNLNPEQAYCQYVIMPKLEKFKKVFKERLKE